MAYINTSNVSGLLKRWKLFGPVLAQQAQNIIQLLSLSPVDISSVMSSVILLAQGFCQIQLTAADYVMTAQDGSSTIVYTTFSLDLQNTIYKSMLAWKALFNAFANIAYSNRLPNLDAIRGASPSARQLGAEAVVINLDQTLEAFLSVPNAAGLQLNSFWAFDPSTIFNLTSLLAIDTVLSTNPVDFGYADVPTVLNSIDRTTDNLVPLNPDITLLLNRINAVKASNYSQAGTGSVRTVKIPKGTTLESLANQYTGDANNWAAIADFNGLVYPYLASVPIEALTDRIIDGVALATDAHIGDTQITIINPGGLSVGQRILLEVAGAYQIVTITSGDFSTLIDEFSGEWDSLSGNIDELGVNVNVGLDQALLSDFPALTTDLSFYPAVSDCGKVLLPGDGLLIPGGLALPSAFIVGPTDDASGLYGTDIALDDSDNLIVINGDFATVAGVDNYFQALRNRFKEPRGELIFYPPYGTAIPSYIGLGNKGNNAFLVSTDAVQTALQDKRTATVDGVTAQLYGDFVELTMVLTSTDNEQFPPIVIQVPLAVGSSLAFPRLNSAGFQVEASAA